MLHQKRFLALGTGAGLSCWAAQVACEECQLLNTDLQGRDGAVPLLELWFSDQRDSRGRTALVVLL